MSRSSYTASERRGIIVIGIIILIIIAAGVGFAFYDIGNQANQEIPEVVEHPEMVDSARLYQQQVDKSSKSKKEKKSSSKKSSKKKDKKTIRKRSPLDEPV